MHHRTPLFLLALFVIGSFALLPTAVRAEEVVEVIDGVEWITAKNLPAVGDPNAQKGGEFRKYIPQYIPTLRRYGPNARLTTITDIYGLTHETLLTLHAETHELSPLLATHWRSSEDKRTFWYKLDPRARFSNGDPVTAHDVVATFKMLVNPDVKDPTTVKFYGEQYEMPVAESDDVVRISTKFLSFRGLIDFAIFPPIFPAKECDIPGDVYLDEYNWKMFSGSGPYHVADYETDLKQEISITLSRRDDWWGSVDPANRILYNFDQLHFVVVRDQNIAFEKFKAGELDYILILKAQRWVEECNFDAVQKGWVQRRKIYNEEPQSFAGYTFNIREWPFDDENVRLAFCYAWNRGQLFEKFMYNEYDYLDSYYPGGEYANPKNRKIRHNVARANRLLDRAGYTKRNDQGIRVHEKTGKALEFSFEFGTPSFERLHRVLVENLKDVGIQLDLQLVDYNALTKRVGERKFKMHYQSWRAATFPNPMAQWHSDLADKTDNNNLSGFRDPRVDELSEEYRECFDAERRGDILREIDGIVFKEYTVALSWFAPFNRILYWNRYGHPDTYLTRFADQRSMYSTWWFDPAKDAALKKARAEGTSLPVGERLVDPWGAKARMEADPGEAEESRSDEESDERSAKKG